MEEKYINKDIQRFLYENGLIWDGVVKDRDFFDRIVADLDLKDEKGNFKAEFIFDINELEFVILRESCRVYYEETEYSTYIYKDLSSEWIMWLIENKPNFISNIKDAVDKKINQIRKHTNNKIKPLKKKIDKIKLEEQEKIAPYLKLRKILNQMDKEDNLSDTELSQ